MKKNIVVNVNLKGGWLWLFSSPRKVIESILENYNNQGYRLVFVLPPKPNPLFIIVQLFCMFITLGFFIPMPSYMFILERDAN